MRYFILLFLFLLVLTSFCYADRVCLEKSTGKLIEYQSGNINDLMADGSLPTEEVKLKRLSTLKQNAINRGYKETDIEVKEITPEEWQIIKDEQIIKPVEDKLSQEELERQQAITAIKTKFNLTDVEFETLKKALIK